MVARWCSGQVKRTVPRIGSAEHAVGRQVTDHVATAPSQTLAAPSVTHLCRSAELEEGLTGGASISPVHGTGCQREATRRNNVIFNRSSCQQKDINMWVVG